MLGLVHRLGDVVRGFGQAIDGSVHFVNIAAAERGARFGNRVFGGFHVRFGEFVAVILHDFLGLVDQIVETVARFHFGQLGFVFSRMGISFLLHAIGFFLAQAAGGSDGDLLFFLRGVVLRRDIQDAVSVDVKRHFDLRHAARSGRNSNKLEFPQRSISAGYRAFALQHVDFDRGLIVGSRRERFRFAGRNGRVALNQHSHYATLGFDAQRQRSDIEQQNVFYFAAQHAALNGRADRNHFIRVYALVWLFAVEEALDDFHDARNAGRAANEHHFIDFVRRDSGVAQGLLHRTNRALQQVFHQLLELGAGQLQGQMLRAGGIGSDERKIDLRLHQLRQLNFRFFRRLLQALNGHAILAKIDALLFLEFGNDPFHHALVDIIAAQVRVAVGGLHFDHAFANFEDGNIEGTAAQVVHGDGLFFLLVQSVRQSGRGGLVNDAQNFETRDFAGLFGRLALAVVEIGRNGDDGFGYFFAEEIFGGSLQFLQNHGRDFRRAVALAGDFDAGVVVRSFDHLIRDALGFFLHFVVTATHKPLDRIHRVFGIRNRLALSHLAHQALAALSNRDYGRGGTGSFLIRDYRRLAPLHYGHDRIGRAQVNTDNLTHG